MGLSLRTCLAALVLVAGFTTQNVAIVWWLETSIITGFGVLVHSAITFVLTFSLSALVYALTYSDWSVFRPSDVPAECRLFTPLWRTGKLTHCQLLAAVGLTNALNGFGIVYASNSKRTPPLIQTILQNGNILASVPFSKLLLGDRKTYAAREPLTAAGLLFASVAVSVAPSLAQGDGSSSGPAAAAWVLVYMFGISQGALYNTIQQLYLLKQGLLRPGCTSREEAKGILRALLFSNLAQAASYVLLFWLDALPWFGYSPSIGEVGRRTGASLACSLFGRGAKCKPRTAAFAWAFVLAYACSYLAAAQLNKESSTFNMLCLVVVTASTAVVFLIPGANPNASGTPVWSVVIALLLSLVGSVLWKRWESRTPAAEQFSVHDGGDVDPLLDPLLLADGDLIGDAAAELEGAPSASAGWSEEEGPPRSHPLVDLSERESD